jgi:hydroxymethylpyrimidine/phosphomethylpyrimidine kinase
MNTLKIDAIPVVMSFSSHDPSGSAGIQADIEAVGAMQCHCAPIITTLTAQDTVRVDGTFPCPSHLLIEQARMVLEDMPIAAFKIGMLGSEENAAAVHTIITDYPDIPVIVDATVISYEVQEYEKAGLLEAMSSMILPSTAVAILSPACARLLAQGADTLDACAQELMGLGAAHVLILDTTDQGSKQVNTFFGNYRRLETFSWDRPEQSYQGAGCTMAAAAAGLMAQGLPALAAIHQAQEYTQACLKQAYRIGMGNFLPNRLFWARECLYKYDSTTEE